jgi:hypothetical protein
LLLNKKKKIQKKINQKLKILNKIIIKKKINLKSLLKKFKKNILTFEQKKMVLNY